MKSIGQAFFNLRAKSFHRPLAIGKDFSYFNANPWPILGFEKRFEQRLPYFLPDLGDCFNRRDTHIIVCIGQEVS